jgi:hypothetical protein
MLILPQVAPDNSKSLRNLEAAPFIGIRMVRDIEKIAVADYEVLKIKPNHV